MKIVILGCGRVGTLLARTLGPDHEVSVIDWRSSAFDRLGADFGGETLLGNGIDADVLREARVQDAKYFLAVTDTDNTNLMAAQIARYLGAGTSICRVYDAERTEIFSEPGLVTVSPTVAGAERLFNMVVDAGENR